MRLLLISLLLISLSGCATLEDAKKWAGEQLEKVGKVIEDLKEKVADK